MATTSADRVVARYHGRRDREVAALILSVQRDDIGLHVPIGEQPELLDVSRAYADGAFWIATAGHEVVVTVA